MDRRRHSLSDAPDRTVELERLEEELIRELRTLERNMKRLHELGTEASALITPELIIGRADPGPARG